MMTFPRNILNTIFLTRYKFLYQSIFFKSLIADRTLHVIDFKYGQGLLVEAENNPQRMLYALDPLSVYECLYEIDEATMTIYQPRRESIST